MKRKQYMDWVIMVIGIIGTAYGAYSLAWHHNHKNVLFVPALVLLIVGIIALLFTILLETSRYIYYRKNKKQDEVLPADITEEIDEEEQKEETKEEAKAPKEDKPEPKPERKQSEYVERGSRSSYSYSAPSTIYVKQVGYGPLLRIEGSRILDMRNNTYYRIENNIVNQEGYGPRFESRGNQVRDVYGGYLYELSGSNINKVFGGFYASISGNYITLYDLSTKFETTDSLSKKQVLAVAALLFGNY